MKFTRVATICLFAASLTTACVPDELEGFSDMGTANNNPNSTTTDTGGGMDMGGGSSFTPEFLAVTAILRPNCLIAGCHGNGSGAVLNVPNGTLATDAEIQTALSNTIPTSTGNRLIAPMSTMTSEIYLRITKPAGDAMLMGAGAYGATATPLTAPQIASIETWITNGAMYTQ